MYITKGQALDLRVTFKIFLLNIQGLTQVNTSEIEELLDSNTYKILCLTETQQKRDTDKLKETTVAISEMRNIEDRKGGGLMVLHKNWENISITKVTTNHTDILHAKCTIETLSFTLILVYISTDNNDRNNIIIRNIKNMLEQEMTNPLVLLGDFSAHVGFIGPQNINRNGNLVLDVMETYNLSLLNADPNCSGTITWKQSDRKSAIDFVLVNQKMYKFFRNMHIDEDNNVLDISDNNVIDIYIL